MTDSEITTPQPPPVAEIGTLAREMARAYKGMAAFYRDQMKLTVPEADGQARDSGDPKHLERVMEDPPDQISWWNLSTLAEHDPDAALKVWERIKAEARNELESGHRAVSALDWDSSPWDRAQFLAVRTAFREEWKSRGGIEDSLLDKAAQAPPLPPGSQLFQMGVSRPRAVENSR